MEDKAKFIIQEFKNYKFDDYYFKPDIPEKKLSKAIEKHYILPESSDILLIFYASFLGMHTSSMIVTEKKISIYSSDSINLEFTWNEIEDVIYMEKYFHFSFGYGEIEKIKRDDILPYITDKSILKNVANSFKSIAKLYKNHSLELFNEIEKNINSKDYKKSLELSEEWIEKYSDLQLVDLYQVKYYKALSLVKTKNYDLADNFIEDFINEEKEFAKRYFESINKGKDFIESASIFLTNKIKDRFNKIVNTKATDLNNVDQFIRENINFPFINNLKSEILIEKNKPYEALQLISEGISKTSDTNLKKDLKKNQIKAYKKLRVSFLEQDFAERKTIAISETIDNIEYNSFKVLKKGELPDLRFPIGHPLEDELYIAHPYINDYYLPIEKYEHVFFMDRVNEFCYLLQCLGATELKINSLKGIDLEDFKSAETEYDVKGNLKIHSAQVSGSNSSQRTNNQGIKRNLQKIQRFAPKKPPYLPSDLVWFENEPSWKRLYQQRMNGNILEYHEKISTDQNKLLSSNEQSKLNIEFGNFVSKINISSQKEVGIKLSENQTTEWDISVVFAPIKELNDQSEQKNQIQETSKPSPDNNNIKATNNPDAEKEYIEEVKFCLENNGVISDDERRFLTRTAFKLGLDELSSMKIENKALNEFLKSNK